MKKLKMTIELLSDTLSGSGEGFGALIDTDVQYDEVGLPVITSKRVKGATRNSLNELLEMPAIAKLFNCKTEIEREAILNGLFGSRGSVLPSSFTISNFFPEEYSSSKEWFKYLIDKYPSIFSRENILSTLTNVRTQIEINDDGVAKSHSLRTIRVVNKKKLKFEGDVTLAENDTVAEKLLVLACANLRKIGTKRNRGLGDVLCKINNKAYTDSIIESFKKEMEAGNENG